MIGKGKAIAHTRASMGYGWNQEKDAEVVFKQGLIGENPQEITQEFQVVQDLNYHCQKNTLSFVLSPAIKDGQKLNNRKLGEICKNFMEQMKLKDRQAIAFVHRNKAHKHIHLYVNRIDFRGVAYKDGFIGKRSQQAAEKVAERMQLTTVKQVQMEREINTKDIRAEIKRRHELSLKQFQPKTFKGYMDAMETNGVKVIPSINKGGKLQGFRFEFDGHNFKGSEVHRQMSGGNIGKRLASNNGLSQFIKTNKKVELVGKTVELSTNMAASIAKSVLKKVVAKGLDAGIGF